MTRSTEKLRDWIGGAVVDVKLDEEEAALAVEPVHPACLAATGEVFWDIADQQCKRIENYDVQISAQTCCDADKLEAACTAANQEIVWNQDESICYRDISERLRLDQTAEECCKAGLDSSNQSLLLACEATYKSYEFIDEICTAQRTIVLPEGVSSDVDIVSQETRPNSECCQ